jgi:hypothetical protein
MTQLEDKRRVEEPPVLVEDTIQTVLSVLPLLDGDATSEKKMEYLSYRLTGFSVREAASLATIDQRTVVKWRKPSSPWYDERFAELERAVSGPQRAHMRKEVLHLLFTRNYHLVLRKDYEVLLKSLGLTKDDFGEPEKVTPQDMSYLNRARGYYTPQQIEVIDRMVDPAGDSSLNFTDFLLRLTRTETMEVRGRDVEGRFTAEGVSNAALDNPDVNSASDEENGGLEAGPGGS